MRSNGHQESRHQIGCETLTVVHPHDDAVAHGDSHSAGGQQSANCHHNPNQGETLRHRNAETGCGNQESDDLGRVVQTPRKTHQAGGQEVQLVKEVLSIESQ